MALWKETFFERPKIYISWVCCCGIAGLSGKYVLLRDSWFEKQISKYGGGLSKVGWCVWGKGDLGPESGSLMNKWASNALFSKTLLASIPKKSSTLLGEAFKLKHFCFVTDKTCLGSLPFFHHPIFPSGLPAQQYFPRWLFSFFPLVLLGLQSWVICVRVPWIESTGRRASSWICMWVLHVYGQLIYRGRCSGILVCY